MAAMRATLMLHHRPMYRSMVSFIEKGKVTRQSINPAGGGRGILYLTLHWHHQNDFCIKMGSRLALLLNRKSTHGTAVKSNCRRNRGQT